MNGTIGMGMTDVSLVRGCWRFGKNCGALSAA